MESKTQEAKEMIRLRMRRKFSDKRKDLVRRVEEQKTSMEREFQRIGEGIDFYLNHLARVHDKLVAEDNPFTKEYFLNVYPPELIFKRIHDTTSYLRLELDDENSGELCISNRFKVEDLEKIGDLRKNKYGELNRLIKDNMSLDLDQMACDFEIYDSVALGFIEVSPEELLRVRTGVSKANSFLSAYEYSPWWKRTVNHREHLESKKCVNPERNVELGYVLTPIGSEAVLSIDKKYAALALQEKIFE